MPGSVQVVPERVIELVKCGSSCWECSDPGGRVASQLEVKEKKHAEKGRGVIRNNENEEKSEKTERNLEQRIQKGCDTMARAVRGGAHTAHLLQAVFVLLSGRVRWCSSSPPLSSSKECSSVHLLNTSYGFCKVH